MLFKVCQNQILDEKLNQIKIDIPIQIIVFPFYICRV